MSRAFELLADKGLLETKFMMDKGADIFETIDAWKPNSSHLSRMGASYRGHLTTTVKTGHLGMLKTGDGKAFFLKPGCHVFDYCQGYSLKGQINVKQAFSNGGVISYEDRNIVEVQPGFIGVARASGEVYILPPGTHQWQDDVLRFDKMMDLSRPHIFIDPFTIISVDEGYSAICIENGKLDIKKGGHMYFLGHENHEFKSFVPLKVQISLLDNHIKCATADNVVVQFEGSVNWKIENVEIAAKNSMNTLGQSSTSGVSLSSIKADVMEQTKASLSQFIGQVNYSDNFGVSSGKGSHIEPGAEVPDAEVVGSTNQGGGKYDDPASANPFIFDAESLTKMVTQANELTARIGVVIYAINIISVYPEDKVLQQSLAQGAVAAALAQKEETAARGNARAQIIKTKEKAESALIEAEATAAARLIQAKAEAKAIKIRAEADSSAKATRAKGALEAAELLSTSQLAKDLSMMETSVQALDGKKTFFFGADTGHVQSLLSNPAAISKEL